MIVLGIRVGSEDNLVSEHKKINIQKHTLSNIIRELTKKLKARKEEIRQKKGGIQIIKDGFFGSLIKVENIYKEIMKIEKKEKGLSRKLIDKREYLIQSFYHYVKVFCEITKRHFNSEYNKFLKEIEDDTYVRNLFAHSYEKNGTSKVKNFISLNERSYFYEEKPMLGIYRFDIHNLDTGILEGEVLFSINITYNTVIKMCEEIIKK